MSRRKLHLTNSLSFCLVPVDNGNVGKDTLAMACILVVAQPLLGCHVVQFVVSLVDSVDTLVYPGVVHIKLKYINIIYNWWGVRLPSAPQHTRKVLQR